MGKPMNHKGSAGFLPDQRIGAQPKTIDPSIIERFGRLSDLTGTISDILDGKGIDGAIAASRLRPTIANARIIGRAITVRNVPHRSSIHRAATEGDNRMAEIEAMHQASPGDVLVIQGVPEVSNLGGVMSTIAKHNGIVGAIVDGGIRDVGQSRGIGFPVWSKNISPMTGKWRCMTEEINKTVHVGAVSVRPGDLVVADETGICFVPQDLVEEVLGMCEAAQEKEEFWVKTLGDGASIPDLVKMIYKRFPSDL